ncbi:uncharacterized protein LOC125868509 [Solanum stenotomum]|uniref:uncharacterized protein LOC125868509 n=1 Tax=Solanum stenotomum TaxID=172797 RepID=UPI0020D01B86|nr:uncharacterized protein LOC125868509 [Solanum stenotomum]
MRSRMSLFVAGLSRQSSKEGKAAMLIGDMDLARLRIHVQQVEEDKMKDRKKFKNKRAKTSVNVFRQQKSSANRNHSWMYRDGFTDCFKCGQNGYFRRECSENRQSNGKEGNKAQSSSVASPDRVAPRGAT